MEKVGIVILNYLNYKDTIECVKSIHDMEYDYAGIVIVDNHSHNESYEVLCREYENQERIKVIQTKKNLGFAKGNNAGIAFAREHFHTDFVFVVNNDTIFLQKDFFDVLLTEYEEGVGVLGPEIQLRGGKTQGEINHWLTLRENVIWYINQLFWYRNKQIWLKVFPLPKLDFSKRERFLHGCALLFTPEFFRHYQGFYIHTFLYHEEEFLFLMCKNKKLKQKHVKTARIFHKEDQSSEMSFQNKQKIVWKYQLKSHRVLLWYIVKSAIRRWDK